LLQIEAENRQKMRRELIKSQDNVQAMHILMQSHRDKVDSLVEASSANMASDADAAAAAAEVEIEADMAGDSGGDADVSAPVGRRQSSSVTSASALRPSLSTRSHRTTLSRNLHLSGGGRSNSTLVPSAKESANEEVSAATSIFDDRFSIKAANSFRRSFFESAEKAGRGKPVACAEFEALFSGTATAHSSTRTSTRTPTRAASDASVSANSETVANEEPTESKVKLKLSKDNVKSYPTDEGSLSDARNSRGDPTNNSNSSSIIIIKSDEPIKIASEVAQNFRE